MLCGQYYTVTRMFSEPSKMDTFFRLYTCVCLHVTVNNILLVVQYWIPCSNRLVIVKWNCFIVKGFVFHPFKRSSYSFLIVFMLLVFKEIYKNMIISYYIKYVPPVLIAISCKTIITQCLLKIFFSSPKFLHLHLASSKEINL